MSKFKFSPRKDIDNCGQTNAARAKLAERAIRERYKICPNDGLESVNAADLIGDIFHLCDRNKWNVDDVTRMAISNWMQER